MAQESKEQVEVGQTFEGVNADGDRITVRVVLNLAFAKAFVVFKRTHCQKRQAEHPDTWLILTCEQLQQGGDLDFMTVLRSSTTEKAATT